MTVKVKLVNKRLKMIARGKNRMTMELKVRMRAKVKVNLIVINRGQILPTKCSERLLKNTSEPANHAFVRNMIKISQLQHLST